VKLSVPQFMKKADLFGLAREKKILASNVREIFTPHMPVNTIDLFFGRQKEVQQLIEQINTPGQHALLYGDRGVGKSSLANIASQLLFKNLVKGKLYTKRCDSSDTLVSVLAEPLADAGIDIGVLEQSASHEQSGKTGISIAVANAGVDSKRSKSSKTKPRELTPSFISNEVGKLSGLLVIDEADVLASATERKKLAELIKHLSDSGSSFKILIVGIAETGTELTAGHPSVHRCLKETKLDRMSKDELRAIVTKGAVRARITFDSAVVDHIASVSAGYPHFTHLLALKCAESAIANDNRHVGQTNLISAMEEATRDAEGTLKRIYDNAARSANSDLYRQILLAAAAMPGHEFSATSLRNKVSQALNKNLTQGSLNNYLKKLLSADGETILKRKAKGVYCFNDPRMQSYIKIANKSLT